MNILILDDEPPARRFLRQALASIGISDVREAGTIDQAIKELLERRPDVMILDVELRGGKQGFDLLETMPAEGIPVIFLTAHAEHAVRAFEARAADYLLKPVDPHRLKESLRRVSELIPQESVSERVFLKSETVMFRDGSKNVLLRVGDIQLLEAGDSFTKLVLGDKSGPMVSGTLKGVLQRMDSTVFFQANRSQAINLDHVVGIEDGVNGHVAVLGNGMRVDMSRRQSLEFRRRMAL